MKNKIRFWTVAATIVAILSLTVPARAESDRFDLNSPHTQILFSVDHLGFTKSYGKFLKYEGYFLLDYLHPEKASVEAVIYTESLDMGDPVWSARTQKLFYVKKYPSMTFKSTSVKVLADKLADVTGNLTLLGVTKPVILHVKLNKAARDPFGKFICGLSATGVIKRSDFGMSDYLPWVGNNVQITLEVEGTRKEKRGELQYNR